MIRRAILAVAAALLTIGAAPKTIGWITTVALTAEGGHLIGNPAAPIRLVEYVSYSSPEALAFERASEGQLRLGYIASGRVALELRTVIRQPIDLTLATLASCGPVARFPLDHAALLRSQDRWLERLQRATPSQRWRWTQGDLGSRNRAVASDLDLYAVMEARGYDRQQVDKCLADPALAARIRAQAEAAQKDRIAASPVFSINGKLLEGVATWVQLRPILDESPN